MRHHPVDRVDAPEILGVERVLAAGQIARLETEIIGERPHRRIEHRNARHAERAAARFERAARAFFDQRVEHHALVRRNSRQHLLELTLGAHHRPHMLDRFDMLELHETRARDSVQRLAGGVGNQVKMEAFDGIGHLGIMGTMGTKGRSIHRGPKSIPDPVHVKRRLDPGGSWRSGLRG